MRNPQPWLRKSTSTWHVWLDGKQVYLGKDEKKARAKFERLIGSDVTGEFTVRQVIQAYWKWCKTNLAESTCQRRKGVLESFSKAVRANLKAEALKGIHVERWIDGCERVKSPTTRGDYITLIKGMMKWARGRGYVSKNPIADMSKPAPVVRQDFLPPDTWQRVLELASDDAFRDYLRVMLDSGARPTEMARFEAQHLTGNRFILPITESKGRRRSRVVYLPADSLAIVQRLAKQFPTGKLFRDSNGNPWHKDSIRCRFRRLRKKLDMPKLTATTLRHSFAHYRLTQGQDALTVSKLMGHVDTRMIATRYGHLEQNADFMTAAANGVGFPSPPATSSNPSV